MKKIATPIKDVRTENTPRSVMKPQGSPFHINFGRVAMITVTTAIIFGAAFWSYITVKMNDEIAATKKTLDSNTATLLDIVKAQQAKIHNLTVNNTNLDSLLTSEQRRRLELESFKVTADKQIDTLTKLTTIDPELIKKYSKIFFLSENYAPPKLKDIDAAYLTDPLKPASVLENTYPFLMNMLKDADNQHVQILVVSAYRSFEYQKTLKSEYKVIYGAGTANQFSADQGYSEHQLGTALDLGTNDVPTADLPFQNTTAFKWLNENAYKYGFVMSYPKANKFYQYEPWHWRFVGRQLALDLHNQGKYFYEMDQREIDAYLIKLFD